MDLLAFAGVAAVVIATPGPDTALTVRNTLWGGRLHGVRTGLGVACGQSVWALATALGVAAVLQASEPLFEALRLAGCAYLVWLGVEALRAAWRGAPAAAAPGAPGGRRAFRQGLVSNLANPKMGVFFLGLLPQFAASPGEVVALGLVFAAMTFAWLSGYAWLVARARDVLRRGPVRRVVDAVSGCVLVALGVRLAAEGRS